MAHQSHQGPMAGSGVPQPKKPNKPVRPTAESPRKPPQVMHITRKEEQELLNQKSKEDTSISKSTVNKPSSPKYIESPEPLNNPEGSRSLINERDVSMEGLENLSMADLLGSPEDLRGLKTSNFNQNQENKNRVVDDFDFDEDAFLAALDENEPVGNTGEIAKGAVIGVESDGVYVDIGGKAPGFMPKKECGLGVITNLKEKFPKGLEVEVLVTREQNADGMVTISCRALALRKSWEKIQKLEAEGKVVQVTINGFNRGGVTCDLEGLRGFIPRSQLEDGANHQSLVGKKIGVAFLEVNPDTRKLVLSEKRAAIASLFSNLEIGKLVEGQVVTIKPYGFFVDIGGISGLLHHSMVTNGTFRSLREVFNQGERIKALITELDPSRARISLNTALLEGPPGEILNEKEKIMEEAEERAIKARTMLEQEEFKKRQDQEKKD